ncbi:uncharacterized protein V6R79_012847 [Siganus canaliculatus]
MHNLNLHEGDIQLLSGRDRNVVLADKFKWEIPVPYVLDDSLDLNAKGVILRAFDQIRLKTCIDFKPWRDEPNYITIIKDNGCWSYVGNQNKGNQSVSIGQWCDHLAIVEHEFLHALGFWHEQSRYDRDDYVTIVWENIEEGKEHNFRKHSSNDTTTLGTEYDYISVMHYGKDDFSNGNGSTILTNLPQYQDVIGQRLEMSPNDVLKLSKLYNCTSSVTFLESCSFEEEEICSMSLCAAGDTNWERVRSTDAGPLIDHTSLTSQAENQTESVFVNDTINDEKGGGFFMHCSTASGKMGHGAKMQSRKMTPKRRFQCLQFFYFHSGSHEDQFNIWMREYDGDVKEITYLMDQIAGRPTSHWKLHHVLLNATRPFNVEFEVRRGAGSSSGGFSVDDINLFETQCPHHVWHVPQFNKFLMNSSVSTTLVSPRFLTTQQYGLQLLLQLYSGYFGVFFRLVSTKNDDQLQWPCAWRQVTVSLLDQSPHIQQRMSKQMSITTDSEKTFTGENGEMFHFWDNPRKVGHLINDTNGESYYAGPNLGYRRFLTFDEFWSGNFIKESGVFFLLNFDDLLSLQQRHSEPPEPQARSDLTSMALLPADDTGACLNRLLENNAPIIHPSSPSLLAVSLSVGILLSILTATVALMALSSRRKSSVNLLERK